MLISKSTIEKMSEIFVAKKNIPACMEELKTSFGFPPEADISPLVNMITAAMAKAYGEGLKDAVTYASME